MGVFWKLVDAWGEPSLAPLVSARSIMSPV
jgi:hypothetical protein